MYNYWLINEVFFVSDKKEVNKKSRDYYDKKCKTIESLELDVKVLKGSIEEFPEFKTNYQKDIDAVEDIIIERKQKKETKDKLNDF
jgi:hypothetical protein